VVGRLPQTDRIMVKTWITGSSIKAASRMAASCIGKNQEAEPEARMPHSVNAIRDHPIACMLADAEMHVATAGVPAPVAAPSK